MSTSTLRWQRVMAVLVAAVMVLALVGPTIAEAQQAPTAPAGSVRGVKLMPVRKGISPALANIPVRTMGPEAATDRTVYDDPVNGPYIETPGDFPLPKALAAGNAAQRDIDNDSRPFTPPDKRIYDDPMPGLDASWQGGNMGGDRTLFGFGFLPPDTQGDTSNTHYIQVVNTTFAIWDYTQYNVYGGWPKTVYGPVPMNTLFTGFGGACEYTNDGDPIVLYDEHADRWLMSQFALPNFPAGPFSQCIAISATSDPLGAWYLYEYQHANKMNDYPKFGVWQDAYYMTVNQFNQNTLSWGGQGIFAFDRSTMLTGGAAFAYYWDMYVVDPNMGGMLPADNDGFWAPPGTPGYVMEMDDDFWGYSPDQLQMWGVYVDWSNPFNTYVNPEINLGVNPFDSEVCAGYTRNCITQPGTAQGVDAISDRLMYRLQYRNFGDHQSMVVNHTVDVTGAGQAGIRWYELRNTGGGWSIYQQGDYAPDTDHRWMGSIAMDASGNIALGYSRSSALTYPTVSYAGRLASDPLGTLPFAEGTMTSVAAGSQTSSAARWGDYSFMAVTPDGCTFVYTQEYLRGTTPAEWYTLIGMFGYYADCTYNATATFRSNGLQDGHVTEKTETSEIGGSYSGSGGYIQVGDTWNDRQIKGILSFDTSSLPDTAVITNARIELRAAGSVGTNPYLTHSPLWVDIAAPSFGAAALAASDFQAAADNYTIGICGNLPAGGWYACDVFAGGINAGINLTGLTQYRLYFSLPDNDDVGNDWVKYVSGNSANMSLRPALIIEYYVP